MLVSDDGTLKINDFDYAVLSDSTLRFSTTTRQGGGTLRWMVSGLRDRYMISHSHHQAPELFHPEEANGAGSGESTASRTKQTDIYALGMVSESPESTYVLTNLKLFRPCWYVWCREGTQANFTIPHRKS